MLRIGVLLLLGLSAVNLAHAERSLRVVGDFESGLVQDKSSLTDGFFVKTLPHPQGDVDEIAISSGGAGPASGLDTRVVPLETVGSDVVLPRSGKFFIRTAAYFNKDYTGFSGNSGINKPRSLISLGQRFDFDTEGYVGFSVFVPRNFEHETATKGEWGTTMLLSTNATSRSSFFLLNVFVPTDKNEAHWFLVYQVDAGSAYERSETKKFWVDLGPVNADKGKWTDFVIRYRANPFASTTNPAVKGIKDAMDRTYNGNKGILRLWKAEGPVDLNGDRQMSLKVDKVNTPVGLVPHATNKIVHSFRIYKFGWHQKPTAVKGPIWFGFDAIRYGLVERDSTAYEDVYAGGGYEGDSLPAPPKELLVTE
jgi:hypothetical protein